KGAVLQAPARQMLSILLSSRKMSTSMSDSGFEEELCGCPSLGWPSDWIHCVCDYEESCFIIQRLKQKHFLTNDCLERQPQISAEARGRLVSWLIAVYRQLSLSFESLCLAVNIMDRFLITTAVEVCSPRITRLLSLCCNSYSKEQLCNFECLILLRLKFKLAAPTISFFLDYFTSHMEKEIVEKWRVLTFKVCELSLADYTFNKYLPSVIVQCALKLTGELLETCLMETGNRTAFLKPMFSERCSDIVCEDWTLFPQCTEELKLLVSLNMDAVHDLIYNV
ncbi:hypothetical protein DNTS_034524, partial [Danionella cerebrum]